MNDDQMYYSFILYMSDSGSAVLSYDTIWRGFADDQSRVELREPRLDSLEYLQRKFALLQMELFVVENLADLCRFFSFGGAAAIQRQVAQNHLATHMEPAPMISIGLAGFASLSGSITEATRRAPSKKLRMKILKRDNFQCRLCGRSPHRDTDIELHVHHIKPWAFHGATDLNNLITLYHTCHDGLEPHNDPTLTHFLHDPKALGSEIERGVERYRDARASGKFCTPDPCSDESPTPRGRWARSVSAAARLGEAR